VDGETPQEDPGGTPRIAEDPTGCRTGLKHLTRSTARSHVVGGAGSMARAVPGGSDDGIPGNGGCTVLAFWRFLGRGLAIRNHATSHAISLMRPHRAPQASIGPASRENLIVWGFSDADNRSASYLRNGRRPCSPANPTQAPGRPVASRPSRACLGNARQRACVRRLRSTPRKEPDERPGNRGAGLDVDSTPRRLFRDFGIRESPVVSSGGRQSAVVTRPDRAISFLALVARLTARRT